MIRLSNEDRKKFFRCQTCGALRGNNPKKMLLCDGHMHKNAYYVNLWEWIKIKLGMNI